MHSAAHILHFTWLSSTESKLIVFEMHTLYILKANHYH